MVEFSRSRPHRLVAQDVALSRPKHPFEPGWGHLYNLSIEKLEAASFV
jgi:hypothetical protein